MRPLAVALAVLAVACGGQTVGEYRAPDGALECPPGETLCGYGCPGSPPSPLVCVKGDGCVIDPCMPPDDEPCPPGKTFCVEGCEVAYPECVAGPCPPPPQCPPPHPGALMCPGEQFACSPCPSVPPECVEPGGCLPALWCPDD